MKCPNCETEITKVKVYSEHYQFADVNTKGEITDYDPIKDYCDETTDIECDCGESLIDIISEYGK